MCDLISETQAVDDITRKMVPINPSSAPGEYSCPGNLFA